MKRNLILVGAALFLMPVAARLLWFYRGMYRPAVSPAVPSYTEIQMSALPLEDLEAQTESREPTTGPVILIDLSHGNNFSLSEMSTLVEQLAFLGARIEAVSASDFSAPSLDERLKYADGLIVAVPTENFSQLERSEIERFVNAGGRLLSITDPTRAAGSSDRFGFGLANLNSDVQALNQLLAPFDLRYHDAYLYSFDQAEGNFRNVVYRSFERGPLTEGVEQLAFYASRPISTLEGELVVRSGGEIYSSLTDGPGDFSPSALSAGGNVLALGDLSFMTPPYDAVFDNHTFVMQIAAFLTSGQRLRSMHDFPHLFDKDVTVLWSENFGRDADSISTASELQTLFGVPLHIAEDAPAGDVLAFATYEPDETVRQLLQGMDISFPDETDDFTLELPGIGSIETSGLGVVLLNQLDKRRALVLLAEDADSLSTLTDTLSSGSLFDCYVSEAIALCKVGETGVDSFDFDFDFDFGFEETPVPEEGAGEG